MKNNLDFALHDPAHCLMPGLFRSFKKGTRDKIPLHVHYNFGYEKIEVHGPWLLGADDLRVLQCLIAMAAQQRMVLDIDKPKTERGKVLAKNLYPEKDALDQNTLVVQDTYYHLAKEMGYADPGSDRVKKLIRESIGRLWHVSFVITRGKEFEGYRILSRYQGNDGMVHVAINPRLARAIMGDRYIRLDLNEVRQLKSDVALLMHQRLCGFIDAGKFAMVTMDSLMGYAWHDFLVEEKSSAMRMRRSKIRKGLDEIAALPGWSVDEVRNGVFRVSRPAEIDGSVTVTPV